MDWLSFILAKESDDASLLEAHASNDLNLKKELDGQTIALVGNARGLAKADYGGEIEKSDIVIRLNQAPRPSAKSHGIRTDWIATSVSLPADLLRELSPQRVLWMTPRRENLSWRLFRENRFYLNSVKSHGALTHEIGGCRPSTGLMVLNLLRETNASRFDVYGFDFFATLSLSGSRSGADAPHDFERERSWSEALEGADERFVFHGHN